jgi:hypothetical protein
MKSIKRGNKHFQKLCKSLTEDLLWKCHKGNTSKLVRRGKEPECINFHLYFKQAAFTATNMPNCMTSHCHGLWKVDSSVKVCSESHFIHMQHHAKIITECLHYWQTLWKRNKFENAINVYNNELSFIQLQWMQWLSSTHPKNLHPFYKQFEVLFLNGHLASLVLCRFTHYVLSLSLSTATPKLLEYPSATIKSSTRGN